MPEWYGPRSPTCLCTNLKQKNREVKKKEDYEWEDGLWRAGSEDHICSKKCETSCSCYGSRRRLQILKSLCVCVQIETIDPSLRPVNTNRCMTGFREKLQMTNEERRRKESNVCSHWINLVPGTPDSLATRQDISISSFRLWTVHTRRLPHAGTGADLHQLENQD